MMKYEQPNVEIVYMDIANVITTSGSLQEGDDKSDIGTWPV